MSDTTKSLRNPNKRRLHEIDDTIESLTASINNLTDFVTKSEFESNMMTAKLKREKIKALSAVVKSQVILAEMEVLIAESDLHCDLQTMKNKKIRLDHHNKDASRRSTSGDENQASTSKSTRSSTKKQQPKKKTKSNTNTSKTSHPDSDETVIVETLSPENLTPVSSNPQTLNASKKLTNSDSEVFLPSSIKQEFETPYPSCSDSTEQADKDKKARSQSLKKQNSPTGTLTVAEPKVTSTPNYKGIDPRLTSTPTSRQTYTYIPYNLPMINSQPKGISPTYMAVTTTNSYMNPGPSLYTASISMPNTTQTPTTHYNFYTGRLP